MRDEPLLRLDLAEENGAVGKRESRRAAEKGGADDFRAGVKSLRRMGEGGGFLTS